MFNIIFINKNVQVIAFRNDTLINAGFWVEDFFVRQGKKRRRTLWFGVPLKSGINEV